MTIFMIILIVIAYSILIFLVMKSKSLINKTSDSGQTSRDLINTQKSGRKNA